MDNRPIGVFDSGVGGLTVAKEIINQLPNEKVIYFGDTARIPYGSKSKETIIKYSHQITRFLLTKDIKAIVIACNTASAMALDEIREHYKDLPIIGVIESGAKSAAVTTKNNNIGIIGTEGTVASGTYEQFINHFEPNVKVYSTPCPLFVPLVEEGWTDDPVTTLVAKRYLEIFKDKGIDTLVLGCTHYPLLTDVIAEIMGEDVKLVNTAVETARALNVLLTEKNLMSDKKNESHEFYVSDRAKKFEDLAKIILEKPFLPVEKINIEAF